MILFSQMKLQVLVSIVTFVAAAACVCYPSGVSASALVQAMSPKNITAPDMQARAAKSKAAKAKAQTQVSSKQQPKAPKESKSKANKTAAAAKKCDKKPSELPIYIPEPTPQCETCAQVFGDYDKDCLPSQVPLKWRGFNVRLCVPWEVTVGP